MYVLSHINIIWFYSKLLKQSPLRQQKALATRNVIKKAKCNKLILLHFSLFHFASGSTNIVKTRYEIRGFSATLCY